MRACRSALTVAIVVDSAVGGGGIRFSQQWSDGWLVSKQWAARSYLAKLWMRKFHSCGYAACLMWLTFIAVVGWGLQLQRVAVERGAGACRGHGQEPVSVSRLRAPLSSANLPIYFSSGIDYRWARPEATTAPLVRARMDDPAEEPSCPKIAFLQCRSARPFGSAARSGAFVPTHRPPEGPPSCSG